MKLSRYDENNVKRFKAGEETGYLCGMCGQYTTLNSSISHKGYNLICNRCRWKIELMIDRRIIDDIQIVGREIEKNNTNNFNNFIIERFMKNE